MKIIFTSIFITLNLIFASTFVNAQSILSTESFDGTAFAPSGWSIKPDLGAQNVWVRRTNGTFPTATTHSGAGLARFSSRTAAAGTKQILVSKSIDYTNRGTSAANLDFWMYRDDLNTNADSITIWVNSTDTLDGTAIKLGTIARNRSIAVPDTQATNGWYNFIFAIPTTFTGNTTTHFIFEGTSETPTVGQGAQMFIDDITFDEFPALCTGQPSIGNMTSSMPTICGGTGSANLSLGTGLGNLLGLTYTWQSAASMSGPWVNFGGNTTTATTGVITATTYYQCIVNCSYSGLSDTTPVFTQVVSTMPLPTISVTPPSAAICAGGSGVELIATGADSYSWLPITGLNMSSGDTVISLPTANTQYTVTGTDINGCMGSATVNVQLANAPAVNITANPSDTVCAGATVILNSVNGGPANGNIYLWSDGVTTRRDTIVASVTTTYSVTVTNAAGCSASDSITIVVTPPSTANFGWTSAGNTFTFADSSIGASSWTWAFGDGNGSTNQSPVYTFSGPGVYQVTLKITGNSCNDDSITKTIIIGPESVINLDGKNMLNVYPNPVKDLLNISNAGLLEFDIQIRNAMGQVVYRGKSEHAALIQIPTSSYTQGIYFVEVASGEKVQKLKFVKE
ncbi:MAG: T9SS type A sorting domain-containing protein [Chitinophagaceae bacterium]|nr:T9SS type A sorting domain-containing protein [Chitinophagaceae bacterium]